MSGAIAHLRQGGEKITAFIPFDEDHGSPSVARQSNLTDGQEHLTPREEAK